MDGLAVYRLSRIPKRKAIVVPTQPVNQVPEVKVGTIYHCFKCGKENKLDCDSVVLCNHCNYRIVRKQRGKNPVVINAV